MTVLWNDAIKKRSDFKYARTQVNPFSNSHWPAPVKTQHKPAHGFLFNESYFIDFAKRGCAFPDLFQRRFAQSDHTLVPRHLAQLRNRTLF